MSMISRLKTIPSVPYFNRKMTRAGVYFQRMTYGRCATLFEFEFRAGHRFLGRNLSKVPIFGIEFGANVPPPSPATKDRRSNFCERYLNTLQITSMRFILSFLEGDERC